MQNLYGSSSLWLLLVGELESPGGRSLGGGGHAVGERIIELRTQLSVSLTPPLTVFPALPSILVLFLSLFAGIKTNQFASFSFLYSPENTFLTLFSIKNELFCLPDFFFQKCLDIFPLLFFRFLFGLCYMLSETKNFKESIIPGKAIQQGI